MNNRNIIAVLSALVCVGLLPQAQATQEKVPDGPDALASPNHQLIQAQAAPVPNPPAPGVLNTRDGQSAMPFVTTGVANSAFGAFSQFSVTTGNNNTAVGVAALDLNNAHDNTAVGVAALLLNKTGFFNTATGAGALLNNDAGSANSAFGFNALSSHTFGHFNTAVGSNALVFNVSGQANTAVGDSALQNATGDGNIGLGASAGVNVNAALHVICIGSAGDDVSDSCYIGKIVGQPIDPATAVTVGVDASEKLGTVASSKRFKKDIKPMDKASEVILALKPVTFHYKSDAKSTPCFGLVAEDVAEANPALVVRDKEGKPYSVRCDQVNAMLLNEFLKEHRKIQEQEATIVQLKQEFQSKLAKQEKQIEVLTAGLQKVSAQLEATKPAPQVAVSNQ